ncbi:MAG: hypothetical protein JWO36_2654 [Myxococcales bacterium]|nr:hypothetical protein [Myxococcales bacterium]
MSDAVASSRARSIADLAAGTILATVEIATTAERVFQAITDPRELMTWWGSPDAYRAHAWESDLRVGGRWRAEGKSVDGKPYAVWGEFLEIIRPRKLVHTWLHDWDAPHATPTKVTYTLDDVPGGTRLTVRHEGFMGRPESCDGHSKGWEGVLGWLGSHLDSSSRPGL